MSRQSELSEGIEEIFKKYKEALQEDPSIDFRNLASYDVLHFLHEQGCVLKSENQVKMIKPYDSDIELQYHVSTLGDDVMITESLIEEDNNFTMDALSKAC